MSTSLLLLHFWSFARRPFLSVHKVPYAVHSGLLHCLSIRITFFYCIYVRLFISSDFSYESYLITFHCLFQGIISSFPFIIAQLLLTFLPLRQKNNNSIHLFNSQLINRWILEPTLYSESGIWLVKWIFLVASLLFLLLLMLLKPFSQPWLSLTTTSLCYCCCRSLVVKFNSFSNLYSLLLLLLHT